MNYRKAPLYVTRGIREAIVNHPKFDSKIRIMLLRYLDGDWGEVCKEDTASNNRAAENDGRIIGLYKSKLGDVFIITEWDRSATTVMFADEY